MAWESTGELRWKKAIEKPFSREDLVLQERWADMGTGPAICRETGFVYDVCMVIELASEWRDVEERA